MQVYIRACIFQHSLNFSKIYAAFYERRGGRIYPFLIFESNKRNAVGMLSRSIGFLDCHSVLAPSYGSVRDRKTLIFCSIGLLTLEMQQRKFG